jgi:hypothetical protein
MSTPAATDDFYTIDGRMFDRERPEEDAEIAQYQRSLPIIKEVNQWLDECIKATESVDYIVMDEQTDPIVIKAQLLAQKYLRYQLLDKKAEFTTRFEHLDEAVKEKRREQANEE